MQVLLKPELAQFVKEQVEAGRYASEAEVLEAGLARLMLDRAGDELDAEDVAAIEEGLGQADRGEVRSWNEVREELRARLHLK